VPVLTTVTVCRVVSVPPRVSRIVSPLNPAKLALTVVVAPPSME
jgi:hypothetical protein